VSLYSCLKIQVPTWPPLGAGSTASEPVSLLILKITTSTAARRTYEVSRWRSLYSFVKIKVPVGQRSVVAHDAASVSLLILRNLDSYEGGLATSAESLYSFPQNQSSYRHAHHALGHAPRRVSLLIFPNSSSYEVPLLILKIPVSTPQDGDLKWRSPFTHFSKFPFLLDPLIQ